MNRKYNIWPFLILLLLHVHGCQEKIDWELEMENELRLVVNGKITNESKAHEVKLSLPVYGINGTEEPVSGAEVALFYDDTSVVLTEDAGQPGRYVTPGDFRAVVDKVYMLGIRVEGYEFHAFAQAGGVTPIAAPGYYRVSADPELYEIFFRDEDVATKTTLELDWSFLPGYDTLSPEETAAIIYGYNFDPLTVDANEIFGAEQDPVRIPPGTKYRITKESLSEGYAEYLRGMLSETTWNGGLFDVKPGDPFTNLSDGALGYFAVTMVVQDSGVFEP